MVIVAFVYFLHLRNPNYCQEAKPFLEPRLNLFEWSAIRNKQTAKENNNKCTNIHNNKLNMKEKQTVYAYVFMYEVKRLALNATD